MPPTPPDNVQLDTVAAEHPVGANVLCLHGLFAGSWVFENLLPLIAARGHNASALSFRGHPPHPPLVDIGRQKIVDYARDATAAARTLDSPIVIAHSLGGLVALMLAGRNLIRAAVLISPAPPRGISVLSLPILMRMANYLPAMAFSRAFLPTASDFNALVLNEVPTAERERIFSRFCPDSGLAARQAALGRYKVPVRAIRLPLLVIGAENDRFIPANVSRKIAARYGGTFRLAPNHGHFLLAEPGWQTEARFMLDWIDALPRPVRERGGDGSRHQTPENSRDSTRIASTSDTHLSPRHS